jgi:hypothetical protein
VAEDVVAGPAAPPASAEPAPASRAERAHTSAYYTRFSVAYTALIALAIGGIGALVLILLHLHTAKPKPWSTWAPSKASALAMERQITTRVSSEYKASTSSRLVTVFPGPLQAPRIIQTASGQQQTIEVPITLIAVQPDTSTGQHEEGDFTFYHPESTVAYSMCGFGDTQQNCGVSTITGTTPTQLLHREALELALYTLKYVPGMDAVIVYLPPPSNPQAAATAIFLSRKDLKANLRLPLERTLKPEEILLGGGVPDGGHVTALTRSRIYTTDYQTLPSDGTAALELTPNITG